MAGPVNTPLVSRKKAMAFANQITPGTAIALTSADCIDVSNVSFTPNAQTTTDPRYSGTIHRPGDQLIGVSYDITFEWLIHGYVGAIPAANAFLPGRILTAWGFTETRVATAIGPEAYTVGTTSGATLGATAVGTTDLYKGQAINFATVGAAPLGLGMIRSYTSGKAATLARLRTMAATGNYTIPTQLAYTLAVAQPVAGASITLWEDGHRMNFRDMRPTAARIEVVTASRDGGEAYCKLTGTFSGTLYSQADEATPTVSISTPIPPFRDGQQDVALTQLGGSTMTIDLGLRSAYPPNPNQLDGSDPGVMVESKRTVSLSLNKVQRSVIDFDVLAQAQAAHPIQAIWGLGTGNYMGLMVDGVRFNYRSSNEGQDFITTDGDAWIDGVDKAIALTFIGY
jgi:hypothetical protein